MNSRKKRMAIVALGAIWLTAGGNALAQKETWNWHFGQQTAYDFGATSGTVATCISSSTVPASSIANWHGGSGAISNSNGTLLFYTDGETIWNASNTAIPNGTGIAGDKQKNMGIPIAKKPMLIAGNTQYYVFTVNASYQLHYTIVTQNGAGVISTTPAQKNIMLSPGVSMSHKLAITNTSNCSDVWVVAHDHGTRFYAYRITLSGIVTTPVISNLPMVDVENSTGQFLGCMKISPNGQLLAMNYKQFNGESQCALFRFDNSTGQVTGIDNPSTPYIVATTPDTDPNTPDGAPNELYNYYGVEFSPNNKVLYTSAAASDGKELTGFFNKDCHTDHAYGCLQLDLTNLNSADITASRRLAAIGGYGMLQLGADGRIYLGDVLDGLTNEFVGSAINKPDVMNATKCVNDCDYQDNVAIMTPAQIANYGSIAGIGLPLFNSSYFNNITPPTASVYPSSYCQGTAVTITLTASGLPGTTFEWRAGSCTSPVIGTSNPLTIPAPITTTTYYVRAITTCGYSTVCIPVTVTVYPPPKKTPVIQGNTIICEEESTTLFVTPANGQTYNWFDNNGNLICSNCTSITVSPSSTSTYYLQTVTQFGCAGTPEPFTITVNPIPDIGLLYDVFTCGDCVTLGGTPGSPDYTYQWSPSTYLNSDTDPNPVLCPADPFSTTTYVATVTDASTGCINTFNQHVLGSVFSYSAGPGGTLNDPDCVPQSSATFGLPFNGYYNITPLTYITQMFSDATFTVTHPDNLTSSLAITYTVTVEQNGCYASDEIVITFTDDECGFRSVEFFEENTGTGTISKMSIYPNPNNGEFTLYPGELNEEAYSILITDIAGKTVYNSSLYGNQPVKINLLDVQRGLYMVTIRQKNATETKKIVIN